LVSILAVLLLLFTGQIAQDDAPHVVGKERLKGAPAGVGVERQKLDDPF